MGRSSGQVLESAVIIAALATIPLTVLEEQNTTSGAVTIAGWLVWSVFAIDYSVGLALSKMRWNYIRREWLGLGIVILSFPVMPTVLSMVRLARLTRLIRVGRLLVLVPNGLDALRHVFGRGGVPYLLGALTLVITAGGALLSLVEPERAPGGLWDGMWWAVVTVTTVGYGDIAPGTPGGRLIAVALMLAGIGLTATMAACIAAHFVEQEEGADIRELAKRLDRIEILLERITAEVAEDRASQSGPDFGPRPSVDEPLSMPLDIASQATTKEVSRKSDH